MTFLKVANLPKVAKTEAGSGFPITEWLEEEGFGYKENGVGIVISSIPDQYALMDLSGPCIVTAESSHPSKAGKRVIVADLVEGEWNLRREYWPLNWKRKWKV